MKTIFDYFIWVIKFIIVILFLIFAYLNKQETIFYFFGDWFIKAPLAIVVLGVLFFGFALGKLFELPKIFQLKNEIKNLKNELKKEKLKNKTSELEEENHVLEHIKI